MVFAKHLLPLLGALWVASAHAATNDVEFTVEVGAGANHTRHTDLLLLGITRASAPLFGVDSYVQFNAGGWRGRYDTATVGVARGLQWQWGGTRLRASLGGSLISDTEEDRLSTAFQFYEQFAVQRRIGDVGAALSFRHWSNGRIKLPNGGMNFLGLEFEYRW
jgi:hypothetical protein